VWPWCFQGVNHCHPSLHTEKSRVYDSMFVGIKKHIKSKGRLMKKEKRVLEDDISFENYHNKQAELFRDEFEEELRRRTALDDLFMEELKRIQKMALIGKLNPIHKQTLTEWRELHPERFDNFCDQMKDENRQKLLHFLHLDDDER